ncbi:MAG: ATP-binding protein [Clostridia bacterium]|nr:ATP-binding protein [Clostridia bacterium]
MGIPVLILGESGSGKSASLRNFKESEVGIINVGKKPLPFKSKLKPFNSDNYIQIEEVLKRSKTKSVVIDDAQYLMANEFMRQAKTTGFQKFTDIALNFWTLVQIVIDELPEDKIVYFLGHIERDSNNNEKFKTVGKMLDEKITIEGLFTIVLKTYVKDGAYFFTTQTNGQDTVKSPIGMFEEQIIDNDLKMVDDTIRDYYELNKKETK